LGRTVDLAVGLPKPQFAGPISACKTRSERAIFPMGETYLP
jgi:hypothetical protein